MINLHTERLLLRPIEENDAVTLYNIYSDPETMRYWSCPPWEQLAQAQAHVAMTRAGFEDGSIFSMGITLRETGELIGVC
eukprot:gene45272-56384_t